MSEGTAFKHIAVVAEPEEDLVIEAGMTEPVAPAAPNLAPEPAPGPEPAAPVAPAAPADVPTEAAQDLEPAAPAPVAKSKAEAARRAKMGKADDYHDPALEDLQDGPMSATQKVVIVAAVVLIVLAVIYCTVFMG